MKYAQVQKREEDLRNTGILFGQDGGVPWLVSVESFMLSTAERDALASAGVHCARFLEVVHAAIVRGDAVGDRICNVLGRDNPHRLQLMKSHSGDGCVVPMIRPDAFWDENQRLTVVEIETMIGGLGMAEAMRAAYPTSGFRGTAYGYTQMLRSVTSRKGVGSTNAPLTVCVANPDAKRSYDSDFDVFARALKTHGVNFHRSTPERVSVRPDGVFLPDGTRTDVLHRFFRVSELLAQDPTGGLLDRFVGCAEAHTVPVIQPWMELLEEKALFAFFHDRSLQSYWIDQLGRETVAALMELLPPTWMVDATHASWINSLMNSTRSGRPFWLKKSGSTWGGRDAIDGFECSSSKWKDALQKALHDEQRGHVWILQERRVCRTAAMAYGQEGQVVERPLNVRISPFCFAIDGEMQLMEVLITARSSTKVHGARDAVMTVCDVMI